MSGPLNFLTFAFVFLSFKLNFDLESQLRCVMKS